MFLRNSFLKKILTLSLLSIQPNLLAGDCQDAARAYLEGGGATTTTLGSTTTTLAGAITDPLGGVTTTTTTTPTTTTTLVATTTTTTLVGGVTTTTLSEEAQECNELLSLHAGFDGTFVLGMEASLYLKLKACLALED